MIDKVAKFIKDQIGILLEFDRLLFFFSLDHVFQALYAFLEDV